MIKKYKDYIILLFAFLLIVFSPYLNKFFYGSVPKLDTSNITNTYCNSLETDYNELLKTNEFSFSSNLNLVTSKVMLRNLYEFKDILTIYKGSDQNITVGSPVINEKGLIGIITKLNSTTSEVRLITNKNSNISVRINSSFGILKMQDDNLVVSDLQASDTLNIGDKIYTSGIGNLPSDIYIGEVSDITLNNTEIEKIVYVKPAVDFSNLNYVLVVI